MGQVSNNFSVKSLEVHKLDDFCNQMGVPEIINFRELGLMKHAKKPHRHTFYALLHIENGSGYHIIDSTIYPIKKSTPMICLLSPCQLHFWELNEKLQGTAIRFSDELFYSLQPKNTTNTANELLELVNCPFLYIENPQTQNRIRHIINLMKQECFGTEMGRNVVFIAYLNILLVIMCRLCQQQEEDSNCVNCNYQKSLINNFRSCVSDHFLEHRNISWYAKKLGVSEGHLHEVIKKATGASPGWIIRKEIVSEAKRLLVHTDLTISEISYKLNFEDPSYFSRIMKREIGMNPTHYRTVVRERYNHNFK